MLNIIWLVMLFSGISFAAWHQRIEVVSQAAITAAQTAVTLSFQLLGIMCLWSGLIRIAEQSGLVNVLLRIVSPAISWLFPSIRQHRTALGAVVLTVCGNLLGLGNASTPLGIKAMQELQKLNPRQEVATPAMCTFMAFCTAGVTLVPITIIALRSAAGSVSPSSLISLTWMASFCALVSALLVDFICRKSRLWERRR